MSSEMKIAYFLIIILFAMCIFIWIKTGRADSGKKIALVVDPPRKGLGQPTIEAILQAKPQNIVYISCDSATLSRDIKALSKVYELKHCTPYDMFPQTDNVETLVVLKKINE